MNLLTTSEAVHQHLHGLTCNRDHKHQPIEGTIQTSQGPQLRTAYTEIYPRKFARRVAQVMCKDVHTRPMVWHIGMISHEAPCDEDNILVAPTGRFVRSTIRAKAKFVRSELVTPESQDDHPTKRRRLDGKQSVPHNHELCKTALHQANQELPRVGKREITNDKILQCLRLIFPEKQIVKVVACRGTDRTMSPPKSLMPQEAPYRRTLLMNRNTGEAQYERSWEHWIHLSNRQLVRPSHPCRINITVFARDHAMSSERPQAVEAEVREETSIPTSSNPRAADDQPAVSSDPMNSEPACPPEVGSNPPLSASSE